MITPFDWQPPIPLGGLELRTFPVGVFPDAIETFVLELSRSTETPLELAALTTLSGIATAIHDKYSIQVKPDYSEPVNIWTVVALPPGCRKSAVQGAVIQPIIMYEKTKQEEMKPLIVERVSRNKSLEARIKEMRGQAAKGNAHEFERLQI